MDGNRMTWTDERIEILTKMWDSGVTASQIAMALGGVSRNAVIGKAHRLGLNARPSPVKAAEEPASAAASGTRTAKPPSGINAAPIPAPKPNAPKSDPGENDAKAAKQAGEPPASAEPMQSSPPKAQPRIVSVGPGGFLRQGPGDQQAPIPPAPPRRLVPARPSPAIAEKTSLLHLNDRICRWPIGHPGEPDFHFCGEKVNPGFPYCVDHCGRAYQAQLPRGARRPPPPLPFGGPRVR